MIERRPIGAIEWLVMTRATLPPDAADREPRESVVLGWRVRRRAEELRIIDVLRDGISAVAQRARYMSLETTAPLSDDSFFGLPAVAA